MKKTLLIITLTISFNLFANLIIRPEGNFQFKDSSLLQARDVEVIENYNPARLAELIAENFQCFNAGQGFRCQRFIDITQLPDGISEAIEKEWSSMAINFTKGSNEPERTNDADVLSEWDVFDSVKIGDQTADKYHYYLIDNEVHKISAKTQNSEFWLIVNDADHLMIPVEKTVRENRVRTRIYYSAVNFLKI